MKTLDKSQPQSMIQHKWIKIKRNHPKEYNGLVFYYSIEPGKYMWGKVVRHPVKALTGDPLGKSLLVYFYKYITKDTQYSFQIKDKDIILPPIIKSTYYFSKGFFVGHHIEELTTLQKSKHFFTSNNDDLPKNRNLFTIYRDEEGNQITDPGLDKIMANMELSSGTSDEIFYILEEGKSRYKRFEEWKKIHFGK